MPESSFRTTPIVAIAAVAVIIFSAVGVGVMTGVIPSSFSKNSEQPPVQGAQVEPATVAPAYAPSTAQPRAPATETARRAASEPTRVASAGVCANCGTVESVHAIAHQGQGSGLGAVGGAVVGGVLGNQIGHGGGRTAATVVGAGAGAFAGNEVEKHVKTTNTFAVAVRMEDGTSRDFSYQSEPGFRAGDRVRVVDGHLVAN